MPKGLKDQLQAAVDSGGKSLNDEVVKRLERSFGPDDAVLQLAEILRPFLDTLSEGDRETILAAARIFANDRRTRTPRRTKG